MATLEETFGKPKEDRNPWLNLPKNEGESIQFFFTGEQRWDNDWNPTLKCKVVKVKETVRGKVKWVDVRPEDVQEGDQTFEPKHLVTTVLTDEGPHDVSWTYQGAVDALKNAMMETGIGTDENVACQVTLTDRSEKPFKFEVKLKKVDG